MARKVIIDAGHGGVEPGAVFEGRKEKNDTLQLAFDLGSALGRRGIQVAYTRVNDVYDSPYEKAAIANRSDADFFISPANIFPCSPLLRQSPAPCETNT